MCLSIISWLSHAKFPLIVISNRDEFFNRQTLFAKKININNKKFLLGGIDKKLNGTWHMVGSNGKWGIVTNLRLIKKSKNKLNDPNKLSRGYLVKDFVEGEMSPAEYLKVISTISYKFNDFNLIIGDHKKLFYFSSLHSCYTLLKPGVYGLSNGSLNATWPKIEKTKKSFKKIISKNCDIDNLFFNLLKDEKKYPENEIPKTGISRSLEKNLSSNFISLKDYGTRSSTVLKIDKQQNIFFSEKSFNEKKKMINHFKYKEIN